MTCGILNLPDCIIDRFSDFILSVVNAPITPLINGLKLLLTTPVDVSGFVPAWQAMVSLISVFYGLFIMAAGFNFIISGFSLERREHAKEWLQNVILMIIAVQSSYLIYSALAELSSSLTAGVISIIDPNFFLITTTASPTIGLQIFLGLLYMVTLSLTLIGFSINYLMGVIGVLLFPFGCFFYFVPPLKDIGNFIINKLMFVLFLPFFASVILLGASFIVKIDAFATIKDLLMVGAFQLVNAILVMLAILAIFRAVTTVMNTKLAKGILFFKGHFLASALTPKQEKPSREDYWKRSQNNQYTRRYSK